jgi:hypothetical protein
VDADAAGDLAAGEPAARGTANRGRGLSDSDSGLSACVRRSGRCTGSERGDEWQSAGGNGWGARLAPRLASRSFARARWEQGTPSAPAMNAHHRKASYRPPPPTADSRTYSAAQLLTGATPTSRLTSAIRRVPYGWQVRSLRLSGKRRPSLNSPPRRAARRHHPAQQQRQRRQRRRCRRECTARHSAINRNRSAGPQRQPRPLARRRIPQRSHPPRSATTWRSRVFSTWTDSCAPALSPGHLVALSLDDDGGQDADIVCLDGRGPFDLTRTLTSYFD